MIMSVMILAIIDNMFAAQMESDTITEKIMKINSVAHNLNQIF